MGERAEEGRRGISRWAVVEAMALAKVVFPCPYPLWAKKRKYRLKSSVTGQYLMR